MAQRPSTLSFVNFSPRFCATLLIMQILTIFEKEIMRSWGKQCEVQWLERIETAGKGSLFICSPAPTLSQPSGLGPPPESVPPGESGQLGSLQ